VADSATPLVWRSALSATAPMAVTAAAAIRSSVSLAKSTWRGGAAATDACSKAAAVLLWQRRALLSWHRGTTATARKRRVC
jgi:hypothetical protein